MLKRDSVNKNGFLRKISPEKNAANLFLIVVAGSACFYALLYLILGDGRFSDVFFLRCSDFFMDFFNSIRDASQGSGVYTDRGVIYPPMANLIYLALSRFTPSTYNDTSFENRYTWTSYLAPMMLVVLVTTVCAIVFFFIVYSVNKNGSRLHRFAVAFFAFFSVPVLYLIERGNIIILSLIALMIYAFTYNSESRGQREIGLLALAFAFSIKLYPVVFGWFLISDKRYKDAVRCAVYGVLMLLLPSFFFGGPACFYQVFVNIFDFSTGSGSTLSVILGYIHMPSLGQTVVSAVVWLWVAICGTCFAFSAFLRSDRPWKTWTLGLVTILCIPSLTSIYSWAFFIIPLVMLFNRGGGYTRRDWTYMIMMTVPFAFLPLRISFHVSPNNVLVYVMTAALSVFCVVDMLIDMKERRAKPKVCK